MNPLQLLPPKVRLFAYALYGVLALAATSATAYYVAVAQATGQDVALPNWLVGGSAALVPIGAAFAAVAVSNTTKDAKANQAVVTAPDTVTVTTGEVLAPGLDDMGEAEDYDPSVAALGYGSGVRKPDPHKP